MVTQTGFVDLDGARLAWTRSGQSVGARYSVLLAHGITDSAACWDRVAMDFAPFYDVIRYDARGHGASDRASSYPFELHTDDLIGLARALRLDRPVLIGHSMGGAHAAVAAAELGARALIWRTRTGPRPRRTAPATTSPPVAGPWPSSQRCPRRSGGPTAAPSTRAGPTSTSERRCRRQGQVDPDVVTWFESWPTTNRWRDLVAKLRCPGLLLTGDPDGTVTTNAAAQARQRWPQLQVVQIKGAGHNVRRDQFEPYWSAVAAFLDAL